MDAVTAIERDHRVMEQLFAQLKASDGAERAELLDEIKARLLAHSIAEEKHVYPALERKDPSEKEQIHHGVDEHRGAEEKLMAVESALASGSAGLTMAIDEFVQAVTHHVEEEESQILPALKANVSAAKLDELGRTFEERRLSELRELGYESGSKSGSKSGSQDGDVTKDELYEQAQQQDIEGRSTMTKDELRQALRKS
jgi:hemerythrin superfamily protein